MTNQELIINGQRLNLGLNFGIRLNRQLISPAELNTKDAQYSFSITVPAGGVNDAAFNYGSIEETRNKFNRVYDAEYIVDGVRLFRGNFKLTGVTGKIYKGNLYVPAPKTVKDIFGELKLNQNPELRIPFSDFATSINGYNAAAATSPQYAIFPYVLYGVLPKAPLNKNANVYSARDLWDASARIGMQDLPPSINPLLILKHIFEAQGYTLQGSAFDDERLTRLYLSYRNTADYVQPWNYGYHAKIDVTGLWSSRYDKRTAAEHLEKGVSSGNDSTGIIYACDFLDATNTQLTINEDNGGNVLYTEVNDAGGNTWVRAQIRVPTAGFYKVRLNASINVHDTTDYRVTDSDTGVQHIGGITSNIKNWFAENIYEIRLLRDRGAAEFGLASAKLNGNFYYENLPQNEIFDGQNIPKYFPQVDTNGQLLFIDLAQDQYHLLGFNFGRNEGGAPQFKNPRDLTDKLAQIQVAKPALSWDGTADSSNPTRLAVKSNGYWKFGRIGTFDNAGDNPDIDIDYSGGTFVLGEQLDASGNPVSPSGGSLSVRIADYVLSTITGFPVYRSGGESSDFLELALYSSLAFDTTIDTAVTGASDDVALVAYYDVNLQFIGYEFAGIPTGTINYLGQPISPPFEAVFVRFSSPSPITVNANFAAAGNIILERFALERYYTYKIETNPADNYEGYAYIHNGAETTPFMRAEFVGGIAIFETSAIPLLTFDPKLTLYLKTPDFDVAGTLVISREITADSEEVVGWELSNKFDIDLNNGPTNYAKRGQFDGVAQSADWNGQGEAAAVVWLEAGELLTVASVCSEGRYRRDGMHSTYGWVSHDVKFNLSVQPFRTDPEWLKVSLQGNGTAAMDWDDAPNFDTDSINLVGFLNAEMKTDDFIDNFCKAFNLRLSQLDTNTFALDVKQSKASVSSRYVNLDKIASVKDRENAPLGLPALYKLGFTIDTEERGYVETGDTGGGEFETGAVDGGTVEQKSTFSYNWFKNITKEEIGADPVLALPIISKTDVWDEAMPYAEAMLKRYTDLAHRFWYFDGLLNASGATFFFNGNALQLAKVSNQIAGLSILSYKNLPYTILDNYFTILINGSSHYTELEGRITAAMYAQLDGSIMAMFNGDLYFIAELGGYDPTGKNKTNIKLIRKL